MESSNIVDIRNYRPSNQDSFFFDNNVWMFLFCPIANFEVKRQEVYSQFLDVVLESGSTIFTSSLILSEFVNRCLRLEFDQWKISQARSGLQFKKDFVGTEDYKTTVTSINAAINKILKCCVKFSDGFRDLNLNKIQKNLFDIDFNDSYFLEMANSNGWKLVTDDRDFRKISSDVSIITYL